MFQLGRELAQVQERSCDRIGTAKARAGANKAAWSLGGVAVER